MLKSQLETLLADEREQTRKLIKETESLNTEISNLKKELASQKSTIEKDIKRAAYEEWKRKNSEFLEIFIRELLEQKLSISTTCDWGGSIYINLYYDDNCISSCSDSVIMGFNGLEE